MSVIGAVNHIRSSLFVQPLNRKKFSETRNFLKMMIQDPFKKLACDAFLSIIGAVNRIRSS